MTTKLPLTDNSMNDSRFAFRKSGRPDFKASVKFKDEPAAESQVSTRRRVKIEDVLVTEEKPLDDYSLEISPIRQRQMRTRKWSVDRLQPVTNIKLAEIGLVYVPTRGILLHNSKTPKTQSIEWEIDDFEDSHLYEPKEDWEAGSDDGSNLKQVYKEIYQA